MSKRGRKWTKNEAETVLKLIEGVSWMPSDEEEYESILDLRATAEEVIEIAEEEPTA